jgi:hypothetical protein
VTPLKEYRLIPLTQEQFAKVSLRRFEELNRFKWYSWWSPITQSFYAKRNSRESGFHRTVQMHRQILGLEHGDKRTGDHRDHDTLNNVDDNLRIATRVENNCNSRMRRSNRSGYKGVCRNHKLWSASIQIDGKLMYLGSRATAAQAYFELYIPAALEHHGEFACFG